MLDRSKVFTAVQAAKKWTTWVSLVDEWFTAVQAAKKWAGAYAAHQPVFTAVQAAKKMQPGLTPLLLDVHCRTGS